MTDPSPHPTTPSDPASRQASWSDEQVAGRDPGRAPTPEEDAAAERGAARAPDVSEVDEHARTTGAHAQGEGEIK
jgi:hypothetical protein